MKMIYSYRFSLHNNNETNAFSVTKTFYITSYYDSILNYNVLRYVT